MHAIWSGGISFGLVNIPVKLYSGAEDSEFHFRMLHKTDHSPIRYARICQNDGREVAYKDIVKGYEYEKDSYVILNDEDFEKANVRATHTIDIIEFSFEKEIDFRYFDKPYYLEPGKGADKAYVLLCEALKKAKKIAIAKLVLHNREHLAVIKPIGQVLVLNQLRFAAQIREPKGLNLPKTTTVQKRELEMALALVDQLTAHFNPKDFHDTYTEDLEKIIANKIKGNKIKTKGKIPSKTAAKDLMAALKASLKKKSSGTKKHKKRVA